MYFIWFYAHTIGCFVCPNELKFHCAVVFKIVKLCIDLNTIHLNFNASWFTNKSAQKLQISKKNCSFHEKICSTLCCHQCVGFFNIKNVCVNNFKRYELFNFEGGHLCNEQQTTSLLLRNLWMQSGVAGKRRGVVGCDKSMDTTRLDFHRSILLLACIHMEKLTRMKFSRYLIVIQILMHSSLIA